MIYIKGPFVIESATGKFCVAVIPQRHGGESLESLLIRTRYTKTDFQ